MKQLLHITCYMNTNNSMVYPRALLPHPSLWLTKASDQQAAMAIFQGETISVVKFHPGQKESWKYTGPSFLKGRVHQAVLGEVQETRCVAPAVLQLPAGPAEEVRNSGCRLCQTKTAGTKGNVNTQAHSPN